MANNTLDGFSGGFGAFDRQVSVFGCTGTTVQQCPNIDKKYVESGETHKVSLTWKVDPDRLLYLTYSTGFRPGGNNRDAFALGQIQSIPAFKADTLSNYEFGFKTQWLNGALRLNGALFWEEWSDVQYSLPGLLGIFYTVNAGAARSRGVEGDISWVPVRGLTLSASGTYVDAKLTEPFCDQELGCDAANGGTTFAPHGTRLPITPKTKVNATARYEFATGPADRAFVQAAASHQSGTTSYLTPDGNAALGNTGQFTTVDFSAGYRFNGISLEAFIVNAFDERGILSKNITCAPSLCSPYARLYPTKPQYYGIKISQRF
jgi:iron complex outermembrane recepter protein